VVGISGLTVEGLSSKIGKVLPDRPVKAPVAEMAERT